MRAEGKMGDSALHFISGTNPNPSSDALVDVVFVHGLTGNHEASWTHEAGGFWPKWIAEDFPAANVYCASYNSQVWVDAAKGGGANLIDLGTILLDLVVAKCGTKRPIVFIGHSLGGLVVKQLIRKSAGASNTKKRSVADRARAIIFLATPHQGADFAKLAQIISLLTSKVVKDIAQGAAPLLDLGVWFSGWAPTANTEVVSYYEVKKYKNVIVVDQASANPGVLGCDPTALDEDHVSIAKLEDRGAHLYESVRALIEGVIETAGPQSGALARLTADDLQSEYDALTTQAASDRRSLAEKLADAGRGYEIERAETLKERFSMSLYRHAAQPSAVARHAKLMSNVESRFNLHVKPAIASGHSAEAVNQVVQKQVVDPVIATASVIDGDVTARQVESVIYYLAGNCHIGWDDV